MGLSVNIPVANSAPAAVEPARELAWNNAAERAILLWAVQPQALRRDPAIVPPMRGIDWVHLRHLCNRNRIESLVGSALLSHMSGEIPPEEQSRYQAAVRRACVRGLATSGALLHALGSLKQRDIAAMPLKGASLAHRLYGNVGLRECGDIDLLLEPRDIIPALEVLSDAGYESEEPRPTESWIRSRGDEYHVMCVSRSSGTAIELHWALDPIAYRCPIRSEELLRAKSFASFHGGAIPVPAAELELLFLCLHGGKHQWSELRWVCDIARYLARVTLPSGEEMLRIATERGATRSLLLGVGLAADVLSAPLPEPVAAAVSADPVVQRLIRDARERMLAPRVIKEGRLERWRYHIDLRDTPGDRLHYVTTSLSLLLASKVRAGAK